MWGKVFKFQCGVVPGQGCACSRGMGVLVPGGWECLFPGAGSCCSRGMGVPVPGGWECLFPGDGSACSRGMGVPRVRQVCGFEIIPTYVLPLVEVCQ